MSTAQVIAATVAALLAAATVWRWRRLGVERRIIAGVVVVGLAVYASGLLSGLPNLETILTDLAKALGPWTYALVGLMAFLETGAFVGFIAPGEFAVILGGVIAGQGEIEILPLIGLVWACCLMGDTLSFALGHRVGREFMLKHGPRFKITEERFAAVEKFFARHGGKTLIIGRFIGFVRPMAPFIAGSSGLRFRRVVPYMIIGTGLWGTTFCLLGYFFWHSFATLKDVAGKATLAFGVLVALIAGVLLTYRHLRAPDNRRKLGEWFERQGEKPALRPLAAVLRPLWRRVLRPTWRAAAPRLAFLWKRLTPGELGIEFTTALAIGGVGIYVFVLYAATLASDPGLTPADQSLLDFSNTLHSAPAIDVVKVFTALGSLPVTAALTLVACGLLAWRRRPVELATLLVGAILVYVGVQIAKAGIDRPRPPDPLVDASGQSYPSGHAAYSTVYVALAVIAGRVLGSLVHGAVLVIVAILLSAAIGLSRVYLHVHYWSDVAGGWGLGFGIFGLSAAVALLVVHIRDNARASGRPEPAAADRGSA